MSRGNALPLARDKRGVLAIESAIVAPLLILIAIGVFQAGSIVSRQQELQSGASDVTGIILAAASGSGTSSEDIRGVVKTSLDLADNEVTLVQRFRCGTDAALVTDESTCPSGSQVSEYVVLSITDTLTPLWAQFGAGQPITFTVNRSIQVR